MLPRFLACHIPLLGPDSTARLSFALFLISGPFLSRTRPFSTNTEMEGERSGVMLGRGEEGDEEAEGVLFSLPPQFNCSDSSTTSLYLRASSLEVALEQWGRV